MTVDITVVVAAYNAASHVGRALESVLSQSYQDYEIIVVDDASTDNTVEVARSYADHRIRVIRHQENRGPAGARNTAFRHATGKWITVCDADDAFAPGRLSVLRRVMEVRGPCIVADNVHLCVERWGGKLSPVGRMFEDRGLHLSRAVELVPFSDLVERFIDIKPMFPKAVLTRYSIQQREAAWGAEWLEFNWQLVATGLPLYLVRKPLYNYRVSGSHLTADFDAFTREIEACLAVLEQVAGEPESEAALKQRMARLKTRAPWIALRAGHIVDSVRGFVRKPSSLLYIIEVLKRKIRRTGSYVFPSGE